MKIPIRPNSLQKQNIDFCLAFYRKSYNSAIKIFSAANNMDSKKIRKEPSHAPPTLIRYLSSQAIKTGIKTGKEYKQKQKVPRLKSKFDLKQSMPLSRDIEIEKEHHRIYIKDLGILKFQYIREIPGQILNACLVKKSDRYYISVTFNKEIGKTSGSDCQREIGLDAGIKSFLTSNNGKHVSMPENYFKTLKKIKALKSVLSKKTKGSNNYHKIKRRIASLYRKAENQKADFFHKLSYQVSKYYSFVAIEDLSIKTLMKNHYAAKFLQKEAIGEFFRILSYKMVLQGKTILKVPRYYPSSQICHKCQHINHKLKLGQRSWKCPNCHALLERDVNAAINILKKAKSLYKKN